MEGKTGKPQIPGGLSPETSDNEDIQAIADLVKQAVEKDMGMQLKVYEAKSYCRQVVAGINYFIKILVSSGDECIHIKIFLPLPCSGQYACLSGIQKHKKLSDPIIGF